MFLWNRVTWKKQTITKRSKRAHNEMGKASIQARILQSRQNFCPRTPSRGSAERTQGIICESPEKRKCQDFLHVRTLIYIKLNLNAVGRNRPSMERYRAKNFDQFRVNFSYRKQCERMKFDKEAEYDFFRDYHIRYSACTRYVLLVNENYVIQSAQKYWWWCNFQEFVETVLV